MGIKVRVIYELDFSKKDYKVNKWYESDIDKSEKEKVCRVESLKGDIDNDKIYEAVKEWLEKTDPRRDVIKSRALKARKQWEALPQETKSRWWQSLSDVVNEMDSLKVDSLWLMADFVSLLHEHQHDVKTLQEQGKKPVFTLSGTGNMH